MDKAFLKAGDKVPICRSVLSREGTVHFQHNYMCQLKHCQHLANILQTISYKCSVSTGYTICDWASEKGPSGHIKFDHIFQLQ